jgi:hypothetical protein
VASLTMEPQTSVVNDPALLHLVAHCFAQTRVKAEVPSPPSPESGDFPSFVRCAHDARYSGRIEVPLPHHISVLVCLHTACESHRECRWSGAAQPPLTTAWWT